MTERAGLLAQLHGKMKGRSKSEMDAVSSRSNLEPLPKVSADLTSHLSSYSAWPQYQPVYAQNSHLLNTKKGTSSLLQPTRLYGKAHHNVREALRIEATMFDSLRKTQQTGRHKLYWKVTKSDEYARAEQQYSIGALKPEELGQAARKELAEREKPFEEADLEACVNMRLQGPYLSHFTDQEARSEIKLHTATTLKRSNEAFKGYLRAVIRDTRLAAQLPSRSPAKQS